MWPVARLPKSLLMVYIVPVESGNSCNWVSRQLGHFWITDCLCLKGGSVLI